MNQRLPIQYQTWCIAVVFIMWPFFLPIPWGLWALYKHYKLSKEKQSETEAAYDIKINELNESLRDSEEKYQELKNKQWSIEHLTAIELAEQIHTRKIELDSLVKQVDTLADRQRELEQDIELQKNKLIDVASDIVAQDYGLYRPQYDFSKSSHYKEALAQNRQKQKEMIKDKTAVTCPTDWSVNGSRREGQKMMNGNIKVILRCFNGECEASINKVKYSNYNTIYQKIISSFEQLNKAFEPVEISLTKDYRNLKVNELTLAYEYEVKKQEERELLREQREQEKEEKALQREIAEKKRKISKEISHISNIISDLNNRLGQATDEEKESIAKQIDDLNKNLDGFEDEQKELDYRLDNIGAGYVYIISNIGAFGPDVYKIGVTRRLDPMERINELGSASVPFKFDVHALIFSYNAYKLESDLHKRFNDNRVNKVNNRKEFFKVSISEIEEELKKYGDLAIEFAKIPEAEEYRQSA